MARISKYWYWRRGARGVNFKILILTRGVPQIETQFLHYILCVKFSAGSKSDFEVILIFKEAPLIFILENEVNQVSRLHVRNSTAAGSVISTWMGQRHNIRLFWRINKGFGIYYILQRAAAQGDEIPTMPGQSLDLSIGYSPQPWSPWQLMIYFHTLWIVSHLKTLYPFWALTAHGAWHSWE